MSQIFPNFTRATPQNGVAAPIQTARAAFTGTGSAQSLALSWDAAFVDTNYTVVYSIEVTAGNTLASQGALVKSASGITVVDLVGTSGFSYVLHAVAFHD